MVEPSGGGRAGVWLVLGVVFTLLLADWVFGSFTRELVRGHALLSVVSEPAGAVVLVDTLELGVTPLVDAKVPPGEYVLRVEHAYSVAHRERIAVRRGEQLQRSVTLTQAVGALSLVSNPRGALVVIDGQKQDGVTPLTVPTLDAGMHTVQLSLPNRRVVTEPVEVLPEQTATFATNLERLPLGKLSIATTPAKARIELFPVVDGVPAELARDYTSGMSLPVQTYLVRSSHPGYEPKEQQFLLRRGDNRIAIDLQQVTATLRVAVTPLDAQVLVTAGGQTLSYTDPVELPVGDVTLRVTRQGYRSSTRRLVLEPSGATVRLALSRYDVTVGRVFRDPLQSGGEGPQLVVLAAGGFRMGDLAGDGQEEAKPAHNVQLEQPFAIGVFEVSNAEWGKRTGESGDNKPVVKVAREQIDVYLQWLGAETGARYRLPTEAEWEYAARAGTTRLYGTTNSPSDLCRWANVADRALAQRYNHWQITPCDDGAVRLAPVGSFAPNGFGLYDMIGNASEWLADCWHKGYLGAPANGRIWGKRCAAWVTRGGAWDTGGDALRVSHRERVSREGGELGFRVVREL